MIKGKITLAFFLLFFNLSLISLGSQKEVKDINRFLNDLQSHQEALGIQAFGVTEDGLDKVIRIHCDTHFNKNNFLDFLKKYSYEKYYIDNIQGEKVFVVTFKEASKLDPYMSMKPETEGDMQKKIKCKRRPEVQLKTLVYSKVDDYVVLKGKLQGIGKRDILTPMAGKISSVSVKKGDVVRAGTIIVGLESDVYIAELKQANEDKKKWKKKYAKRLKWKVRSPRAEKQAQERIKDAEFRIAKIQKAIESLSIKASVSGIVKEIVSLNKKVSSQERVAILADNSRFKVILKDDISFLQDGYNTLVEVKNKKYRAFVKKGVLFVQNDNGELFEGDLVESKVLKQASRDAVLISSDYVMEDGKGNYVYVVEKKRAKKRYIKVDDIGKGDLLVKEGLKEGEEIVATNLNCMKDNLKVKVMIWDNKTGKLRKRKKDEASLNSEIVETKQVYADGKQRILKRRRRNDNFSLLVGATFFNFKEDAIKDVYSSMIPGGTLGFSYKIYNRYEIFLAASYLQKNGEFTYFKEKATLTVLPVYLGLKVHVANVGGFTPYAGAAFVYCNVKEDVKHDKMEDIGVLNDKSISLLGGCYYDINSSLSVFFDMKYDFVKIKSDSNSESDESSEEEVPEVDFSGLRLSVGLRLKF